MSPVLKVYRIRILFLAFIILIRSDIFGKPLIFSTGEGGWVDGVGKQEAPMKADKRKLKIKCCEFTVSPT